MRYKAELEQKLTLVVKKDQPSVSRVSITQDGNFAFYNFEDRYTFCKLSPAAKEFLRSGDPKALTQPLLLDGDALADQPF